MGRKHLSDLLKLEQKYTIQPIFKNDHDDNNNNNNNNHNSNNTDNTHIYNQRRIEIFLDLLMSVIEYAAYTSVPLCLFTHLHTRARHTYI